jgi:hypothetical protein
VEASKTPARILEDTRTSGSCRLVGFLQ